MSKKLLIVLIGLPGCGKSTISNILAARFDSEIVSSDGPLELYAACNDIPYNVAFERYISVADQMYLSNLKHFAALNTPVIIADRTHMNRKARERTIQTVHSVYEGSFYNPVYLRINCSEQERQLRNASRAPLGKDIDEKIVDRMMQGYQEPALDSGQTPCFYIDNTCKESQSLAASLLALEKELDNIVKP